MAGRVTITVLPNVHHPHTIEPLICPAAAEVWPKPRCVFSRFGMISVCPFFYGLEGRNGGRWLRMPSVEPLFSALADEQITQDDLQILCLRQESKDTPPGAW